MKHIIWICLLALLLTGCSAGDAPVAQATQPEGSVSSEPAEQSTEATAPPAEPEETTAPEETQPEIWVPFDGDGRLNYGTVLLGDSLTCGLVNYLNENDLMGEGLYMAVGGGSLRCSYTSDYRMGAKITASFGGNLYSPEFEGLTIVDGLAAMGEDVQAVYIMFGTNESHTTAGHEYITAVDMILESCPNALVFLQTIPLADSLLINTNRINDLLEYVAYHYAQLGEDRFILLDSNSIFTKQHLLKDGIHLGPLGQQVWHQWLIDSAAVYYQN